VLGHGWVLINEVLEDGGSIGVLREDGEG
jgi:hypothetical protein